MIRRLARPMLASVYIIDGVDTLVNTDSHLQGTQTLMRQVRTVLPRKYQKRIPQDPAVVARAVGAAKVTAGSTLALGKAPRLSATTLAVLAVPTLVARHAFWETQDPVEKTARRQGFFTSLALLGGLFITSADTAGKPGLRWRASKAAQKASNQIQQALPQREEAQGFFNRVGDFVETNVEKVGDFVESNKDDWLKDLQDGSAAACDFASQVASSAQEHAVDAWQQADVGNRTASVVSKLQSKTEDALEGFQRRR